MAVVSRKESKFSARNVINLAKKFTLDPAHPLLFMVLLLFAEIIVNVWVIQNIKCK